MLNEIQKLIKQGVQSEYFVKAYTDVRLSNGKLISYNENGTNGDFTGIEDSKENYFYIRVISDAVATDERTTSCGNNVMQATLRIVAVGWETNIYTLSGFVTNRLKASAKRIKILSVNTDYDNIWNNEMPGTDLHRYNGLNVVSIDFNIKFSYKQIISDTPCSFEDCEPEKLCKDGFVIIKDEDGNIILEQTVPSGSRIIKTIDLTCQAATAVLRDLANNIISTTDIPSGDIVDIPAPNGTVTAVNSNNSFSQSQSVLSGGVANINLPDITVNESDGSTRTQPSNTTVTCIPVTPLAVDFSVNDATPDTNQTITFTDLTVGASSWVWNFGDGTTSNLQNPTKSYRYAGTYTVTLAAENGGNGGIETKIGFIVVTLQSLVTTNLQAHYRGLIGATPPNATLVSGAISQWNDGTANAFHLTQGGITSRPLYSVTEITSPDGTVYGGTIFDGINDFLSNAAAGFTRGAESTMFMLFRHNTFVGGSRVVFSAAAGTGAIVSNLSANPQYRLSNGGNIDTFMAYPIGNYFLLRTQFSNIGNAVISINNLIERAITNTGANTDTGIVIGGNNAGTAQSFITFIEGAVYSTNPSAGNLTDILNYFKSKFGLWI